MNDDFKQHVNTATELANKSITLDSIDLNFLNHSSMSQIADGLYKDFSIIINELNGVAPLDGKKFTSGLLKLMNTCGFAYTAFKTSNDVGLESLQKYITECASKADELAFKKKDQDYNNAGVDIEDYFIFGIKSGLHEISKKIFRMRSLFGSGEKPLNEQIEDSFWDLFNYIRFTYATFMIYGTVWNFFDYQKKLNARKEVMVR